MKRQVLFDPKNEIHSLVARHIEPPFSILNSTSTRWQIRKRWWKHQYNLGGIEHESDAFRFLGGTFPRIWNLANCIENVKDNPTGDLPPTASLPSYKLRKAASVKNPRLKLLLQAYSVFDPVLAELMCTWFCPKGGRILDPFAGEPTKGIVATVLGFDYTGIELRQQQVTANVKHAAEYDLKPNWVCGDSKDTRKLLRKEKPFDLVFTSPPYYDLEKYSTTDKNDISRLPSYEKFMLWYRDVFAGAIYKLKDERFLVVKVGEIRDPNGRFRNFVGDNVTLFTDLGLAYYNEATLISPVGTAMLRTKHFRTCRKLAKLHQNILIFFKTQKENISKAVKAAFNEEPE